MAWGLFPLLGPASEPKSEPPWVHWEASPFTRTAEVGRRWSSTTSNSPRLFSVLQTDRQLAAGHCCLPALGTTVWVPEQVRGQRQELRTGCGQTQRGQGKAQLGSQEPPGSTSQGKRASQLGQYLHSTKLCPSPTAEEWVQQNLQRSPAFTSNKFT